MDKKEKNKLLSKLKEPGHKTPEEIISDFTSKHVRLKERQEQKLIKEGIQSNNPFIRNRRSPTFNGLQGDSHSRFVKTKKGMTSSAFSGRVTSYEAALGLKDTDLDSIFDGSWGIDFETKGLRATHDSIIEVAFKRGNKSQAFFAQQASGFSLAKEAPFLHQTGFGKLAEKLDFTRPGVIPDFNSIVRGYGQSFSGTATASVVNRERLRQEIQNYVKDAKKQGKAIYAMNARFEMRQADALFLGTNQGNPLRYSDEYEKLTKKLSRADKDIWKSYKSKKLSNDQAFSKLYSNQQSRYIQALNDSRHGGKVVEVREFFRMLNAASQNKGLAPKTGRFGSRTSVDYLSQIFLKELEAHEGVLDIDQQQKLAKNVARTIGEIESGNYKSEVTKSFIKAIKTDPFGSYKENTKKNILNTLEANGDLGRLRNLDMLEVEGLDHRKVFDEAMGDVFKEQRHSKSVLQSNGGLGGESSKLRKARVGSLLFGGILLGSAITNLFKFSASDDEANTIEGLRHGSPVQDQRQYTTSFGSGFRTEKFHQPPQDREEQEAITWKQLGYTGLGATGAYAVFQHQAARRRLNDVTYLGALSDKVDNETLLNRKHATAQDVAVAGIRRMESSFAGLGKAFGLGDIASIGMYDTATFSIDLTTKEGGTYAQYMNKVLNRKLIEEGVDSLMFKSGELFERIDGNYRKVKGKYSLIKTVTNHDLSDSISSLAKSTAYQRGIANTNNIKQFPFLIVGGDGDWKRFGDFADSFIHETVSKPMKLLADPLEAVRQLFPDLNDNVTPKIKKYLNPKYMPDVGLDGKELVTDWRSMIKSHGVKLGSFATMAYFGLGTLNWGAEQLAPDGTPIGDAGLVGAGAYAVRKGHELYARISDMTGLTALRDYVDEKAPGSDGWQTTVGLTGAGALFGGLFGGTDALAKEAFAEDRYKQFIANKSKTESFSSGIASKVFKDKMTSTGKAVRTGGLIGFALALPFTLAGLGADTDAQTLAAEYAGEKEVAVRKGRFWETSFTPWEGGEIDYYRPNWYAKLMDDAKNEELYGGDISPIEEAYKTITDPYWLEKRRYHSQPYPITGPDGSMLGLFGPAYEATIGRIFKPVATMHESVYPEEMLDNTEYDLDALARKQWNASLEFIGLRGFAVKAMKKTLTGSDEIFEDNQEARSAKDIDSVVRDFYDLQIGGGMLTTEALRRVFQKQESFKKQEWDARRAGFEGSLNPAGNMMPSWMPGEDYVTDFRTGDPFAKVKDGYYRLPGAGFATRYEELKGVNPEDYADIYKYKILSDVAYGSRQHREIKGRLQNRKLTKYEQEIFDEVQRQIDEKKESEVNVRDPKTYDSFLGRYSAFLTDLARSNPLETLLPISPAHKFLGPPDVEEYVEEKRFSRDYRNWGNPIDDFVLPTVSMTLNNMGIGGFDLNDDPNDYFDKVDYLKYTNLANEARASGNLQLADQYTVMAQKTYTGKDLYSHPANVASSMPKHERSTFNYFVGADLATKQKMLNKVDPRYRDAYVAQYDRELKLETERNRRISDAKRKQILREIERRRSSIEARRKADIQDMKTQMPGPDWSGWKPEANTQKIKNVYIDNRARDYHGEAPRRSSRSGALEAQAVQEIPKYVTEKGSYSSHYSELNRNGIENALVVLRPGIDNSAKINLNVNRIQERNEKLREWGYIQ